MAIAEEAFEEVLAVGQGMVEGQGARGLIGTGRPGAALGLDVDHRG
jgi:hypothetical protein